MAEITGEQIKHMLKVGDKLLAERRKQIIKKGWSIEHDDGHSRRDLALAAASFAAYPISIYTSPTIELANKIYFDKIIPFNEDGHLEGKSAIRRLVIAGALIIAEIERLERFDKSEDV